MGRDDSRWLATLKLYEISANELTALVRNQIEILRFMEFRVRPLVTVSKNRGGALLHQHANAAGERAWADPRSAGGVDAEDFANYWRSRR